MQQETTNESAIGVPSPLCSVCGDISTGKYDFIFEINHHFEKYLYLKEYILVVIVVKVVKHFFVDQFNVIVFKIINVQMKVNDDYFFCPFKILSKRLH
jgi:hypothetical protein